MKKTYKSLCSRGSMEVTVRLSEYTDSYAYLTVGTFHDTPSITLPEAKLTVTMRATPANSSEESAKSISLLASGLGEAALFITRISQFKWWDVWDSCDQ